MNIYLHPSGVKKELKNDYIWEFVSYTPNANTLLYLPLKSDLNDYSWNNKNFSVYTWSVSYVDNMMKLNNATIRCSSMALTGTGDFTILCYNKNGWAISLWNDTSRYPRLWLRALGLEMYSNWWYKASDSWYDWICFLVWVRRNNSLYFYRNWTLIASNTSVPSINISWWPGMYIWWYADTSDNWYYGSVIVENRAWNADEILKFYNNTKSNYWL